MIVSSSITGADRRSTNFEPNSGVSSSKRITDRSNCAVPATRIELREFNYVNSSAVLPQQRKLSIRIIHDAWASTWRKLVSLGYCSNFEVSTGHPRREIDEFAKLASASGEPLQRTNQTPVVVNDSGSSNRGPLTHLIDPTRSRNSADSLIQWNSGSTRTLNGSE